jgi:hypothetical protein
MPFRREEQPSVQKAFPREGDCAPILRNDLPPALVIVWLAIR